MFSEVWQRKELQAHFTQVWQGKDLQALLHFSAFEKGGKAPNAVITGWEYSIFLTKIKGKIYIVLLLG